MCCKYIVKVFAFNLLLKLAWFLLFLLIIVNVRVALESIYF